MNYQEDSVIALDCFGVLITKETSSKQLFQYCFRKNIELLDYLKHLHTQEVKLSILSNTDRKTLRKYFTNEELDLFDSIFISQETKKYKPSIDAFLQVQEFYPNYKIVLLDDLKDNITVANSLGIYSILYQNNNQAIKDIDSLCQSFQK